MSYQALYRTYRPTKFSDVVGQKHIIKTLKNAVSEDRVMHAYIFSGPRGIGKTTIARILAKAVNCENSFMGEPCNECNNCSAIIDEETTDIVEIDAASNNGVEEMRDILEKVNFLPSRLKKKVYIIDEAHMLSTAAFNALLKTLEEPPSHVIFILATTEPYKIPATILSRCQRFDFQQLTIKEIKAQLRKIADAEDINISDDALASIAEAAEGGMRDALSILDQVSIYNINSVSEDDVDNVIGRVADSKMVLLMKLLNEENVTDALALSEEILESGKETSSIVNGIVKFSRALLLYKNGALQEDSKKIYTDESFINLANNISESKLFYFIDVMIDTQNKIRYVNSPKIFLEIGLLKIIDSASEDIDLLNKIKALETKIASLNVGNNNFVDVDPNNSYDAKIKRLANTIEKLDIPAYKEFVNAKISMLEEVSSKFATVPEDLNYRLDRLEENEKISKVTENPTQNIDLTIVEAKVNELIAKANEENKSVINMDEIDKHINEAISCLPKEDKPELNMSEFDERINNLIQNAIANMSKDTNIQTPPTAVENSNMPGDMFNQLMDLIDTTNDNIYKIEDKLHQEINEFTQKDENNETQKFDDIEAKYVELKTNVDNWQNNLTELETKLENELNNAKLNFASIESIEESKQLITKIKEENLSLGEKINELEKKINEPKEEIRKRRSPFEVEREPLEEKKPVTKQESFTIETETKPVQKEVETIVTPSQEIKKTDTTVVIRTQPAYQQTVKEDETAKVYDHKIVERILNQAREIDCREQKVVLARMWNRLDEKVGNLLAPIAKMLMDGKLTANGHEEILIVYPNAGICNNLMSPKTHANAKQILRITFGKDYDFMALPENTWQQKRLEYTGQYNMGNKYPKLTPINNPELKVIVTNPASITSKKSQAYQSAESLFGSELVERETD